MSSPGTLALFASAAVLCRSDEWCRSGKPFDFPTDIFSNVSGIADNACCHYFIAQHPATLIDLNWPEATIHGRNDQIIPANVSELLGEAAVVEEIDYLFGWILAPLNNGTHGALVSIWGDNLTAGSSAEIVSEPLSWVVGDYNTELAFAGSARGQHVFVFDLKNLPSISLLRIEQLKSFSDEIAGSALKGYNAMYLLSKMGKLYEVDLTTFEQVVVGNTSFDTPVRGLANLWENGDGVLHVATPSQIQHYDTCSVSV